MKLVSGLPLRRQAIFIFAICVLLGNALGEHRSCWTRKFSIELSNVSPIWPANGRMFLDIHGEHVAAVVSFRNNVPLCH